jgi:hypothetical protein
VKGPLGNVLTALTRRVYSFRARCALLSGKTYLYFYGAKERDAIKKRDAAGWISCNAARAL